MLSEVLMQKALYRLPALPFYFYIFYFKNVKVKSNVQDTVTHAQTSLFWRRLRIHIFSGFSNVPSHCVPDNEQLVWPFV